MTGERDVECGHENCDGSGGGGVVRHESSFVLPWCLLPSVRRSKGDRWVISGVLDIIGFFSLDALVGISAGAIQHFDMLSGGPIVF